MADRIYAGGDLSVTYNVGATGSESYKATLYTPSGKKMPLSVSTDAPNITVSLAEDRWPDTQTGLGRIEVRNETTNAVKVFARVRIIGTIHEDYISQTDSYWYG